MLVGEAQGKGVTHRPISHHLVALLTLITHRDAQTQLILITRFIGDQAHRTRGGIAAE